MATEVSMSMRTRLHFNDNLVTLIPTPSNVSKCNNDMMVEFALRNKKKKKKKHYLIYKPNLKEMHRKIHAFWLKSYRLS